MVGMENLNMRPGKLTAHQVATLLGISLGGVRQLVRRGQLHRAGGTERQPWYDLDDALALNARRRASQAA